LEAKGGNTLYVSKSFHNQTKQAIFIIDTNRLAGLQRQQHSIEGKVPREILIKKTNPKHNYLDPLSNALKFIQYLFHLSL
jgi:hypothetical protein